MLCVIWYHLYDSKKRKKHPWRSVTFSKVAGFSLQNKSTRLLIKLAWKLMTSIIAHKIYGHFDQQHLLSEDQKEVAVTYSILVEQLLEKRSPGNRTHQ